jgi:hypothetical protein
MESTMTSRTRIVARTHLLIPDTQVEPGRAIDHLDWIGQYRQERYAGQALTTIHLGDHWNMGSLSSYDRKGGKRMEGRRIDADVAAGDEGFALLDGPATKHERSRWDDHLLLGNHENRVQRAYEQDAALDGAFPAFGTMGWKVHDFLEPVNLDGVIYSHYFYNPSTGRPYAGANLETRLKTIGFSFTMGHQQGLKWGRIETIAGPRIGLVAGSCYLHQEDYLGPQAINYWRGIVVCNNVEGGSYDPMFVSLDYLCRRYEGKRLVDYKPRRFA